MNTTALPCKYHHGAHTYTLCACAHQYCPEAWTACPGCANGIRTPEAQERYDTIKARKEADQIERAKETLRAMEYDAETFGYGPFSARWD